MTFIVSRQQLATELSLLSSAGERKITMPILAHVRFDFEDNKVKLTATDLDVTLITELPCKAKEKSFCAPLKQLNQLVKLLEGNEVQITPKANNRHEIKCGKSKHTLVGAAVDTWPSIDRVTNDSQVTLDGKMLREALKRLLPCVTTEESRYILQGVQFESKDGVLSIAATDSHRLGVFNIPCAQKFSVLVPSLGMSALADLDAETIYMKSDDSRVEFSDGTRTLISRLLVGQFPNWRMIIPNEIPYKVNLQSKSLSGAIKRAGVTRDSYHKVGVGTVSGRVKLTLNSDSVIVETEESDKGASQEPVEAKSNLNGNPIEVGFNPDYLEDFLRHVDGEINWELKTGTEQSQFSDPKQPFRYILMPVRL